MSLVYISDSDDSNDSEEECQHETRQSVFDKYFDRINKCKDDKEQEKLYKLAISELWTIYKNGDIDALFDISIIYRKMGDNRTAYSSAMKYIEEKEKLTSVVDKKTILNVVMKKDKVSNNTMILLMKLANEKESTNLEFAVIIYKFCAKLGSYMANYELGLLHSTSKKNRIALDAKKTLMYMTAALKQIGEVNTDSCQEKIKIYISIIVTIGRCHFDLKSITKDYIKLIHKCLTNLDKRLCFNKHKQSDDDKKLYIIGYYLEEIFRTLALIYLHVPGFVNVKKARESLMLSPYMQSDSCRNDTSLLTYMLLAMTYMGYVEKDRIDGYYEYYGVPPYDCYMRVNESEMKQYDGDTNIEKAEMMLLIIEIHDFTNMSAYLLSYIYDTCVGFVNDEKLKLYAKRYYDKTGVKIGSLKHQ